MVPPPTRGWSRCWIRSPEPPTGSPAHAGMVPSKAPMQRWKTRFPRPRGDGPGSRNFARKSSRVPPPTRGWSPRRHLVAPPGPGSPAHAGMVLDLPINFSGSVRFPRPRGDGPYEKAKADRRILVPPPTRGWSLPALRLAPRREGSPAHAGMVPVSHMATFEQQRFPRPRGDGPRLRS